MNDEALLFVGRLPLPPSVNASYATNWRTQRRHKTEVARDFHQEALRYIMSPATAVHPYQAWLNTSLAEEIQKVYTMLKVKRTKALLAQRPRLALYAHFVVTHDCDTDNRIKALQDTLAEGIGFNDNAIIEAHEYKTVQRGGNAPFADVILRVIQEEIIVGFLLENMPCLPTRVPLLTR